MIQDLTLRLNLKPGVAVCFDFDGVIHNYSNGWQDGSIYDSFNPKIMDLMLFLTTIKIPVFICSARSPEQIKEWWDKQGFSLKSCLIDDETTFWNDTTKIGITNRKLPAQVYIDDRAYRYEGQTPQQFLMDFSTNLLLN